MRQKQTAGRAIEPLGYTNIRIYAEGILRLGRKEPAFGYGTRLQQKDRGNHHQTRRLNKMITEKKDDYVLVDVRDASEYKEGHPDSNQYPVGNLCRRFRSAAQGKENYRLLQYRQPKLSGL